MNVLQTLAAELGLNLTQAQAYRQFRGVRMADCVQWIGAQLPDKPHDFDAEFTRKVRATMAEKFREGLDVIPGAFELLNKLTIPYCVATNGPRDKVTLTLGVTGLLHYFEDRIFSAYELGYFKPDPRLFLAAAEAMGVQPAHCAVVEDSLPGIQAGIAAGMQVFSLLHASHLPPGLAQYVSPIQDLRHLDADLHHADRMGLRTP